MATPKQLVEKWREVSSGIQLRASQVQLKLSQIRDATSNPRAVNAEARVDIIVGLAVQAWEVCKEMQDLAVSWRDFRDGREATSPPEASVPQENPGLQPPEENAGEGHRSSLTDAPRP